MPIQVGSKSSAAIQLDTGTVQGSALSAFLFDLFINALLRLLDSTGISHRVRGVPDWNHQAFADDLSLYVGSTDDANTVLDIVSEFQEWSGLPLSIQIEGFMLTATCRDTGLDFTMTIQVGDRQYSNPVDGQARNPGLPSLRECIFRSYGQARWLYELPGMDTDPESDEWADGVKTIRIPRHLGIGVGTSRQGPPNCITSKRGQ